MSRRWNANTRLAIFRLLLGMSLSATAIPVVPEGPEACFASLQQYCKNFRCPSYKESVGDLERFSVLDGCHRARRGSCGDLNFTTRGGGFGGETLYFEASGDLVAVTTFTDVILSGPCRTGWRHFGKRFSCTIKIEQEYCPSK